VPGGSLLQSLERRRFAILSACLLMLFVIHPLLPTGSDGEASFALDAALSVVLLAALWSLKWRGSAMLVTLIVMAATLAVVWIAHAAPSRPAMPSP
jgi:hypothetical protein